MLPLAVYLLNSRVVFALSLAKNKMKYLFLLILVTLSNYNIAQSNCEELKTLRIERYVDEHNDEKINKLFSKLDMCDYDSIEIAILQTKVVKGNLILEIIDQQISKQIYDQEIKIETILDRFEAIRNQPEFEEKKLEVLEQMKAQDEEVEMKKSREIMALYPTRKFFYDINEIRNSDINKPILILFTNINCDNCSKFVEIVLKDKSVAEIINNSFYFIELQTNHSKKNVAPEIKENNKLQIEYFKVNHIPYIGILNNHEEKLGNINYMLNIRSIKQKLTKIAGVKNKVSNQKK